MKLNIKKFLLRTQRCTQACIRLSGFERLAAKLGLYQPKVISMIDGGLASQMWQFILGYSISRKTELPLYLDISIYDTNRMDSNGVENRFFLLFDTFSRIREEYEKKTYKSADLPKAFSWFFSDKTFKRRLYDFTPDCFKKNCSVHIQSYWCNVKYVLPYLDEVKKYFYFNLEFSPDEQRLIQQIERCCSCALHIRRGDFANTGLAICREDYYHRAVKEMQALHPEVTFFVFSNDEQFAADFKCKGGYDDEMIIITGRNEVDPRVDLYLQYICKHAIIANSGFSYLPALLSRSNEKTVIMPNYWIADCSGGKLSFDSQLSQESKDAYYIPGWIKLPVDC